jgi:hypothetical protein
VHIGGPSASISELRVNIQVRDKTEKVKMHRKAKKKLTVGISVVGWIVRHVVLSRDHWLVNIASPN